MESLTRLTETTLLATLIEITSECSDARILHDTCHHNDQQGEWPCH